MGASKALFVFKRHSFSKLDRYAGGRPSNPRLNPFLQVRWRKRKRNMLQVQFEFPFLGTVMMAKLPVHAKQSIHYSLQLTK